MSSPEKKRRRKKTTKKQPPVLLPSTEPTPNPSLPDELLVSCLARVSRLYYPTLSLVSKSFRSLVASPYLYETRSSLGRTQSCLYVCIQDPSLNHLWFTLCKKPDQTLNNDTSTKKNSCPYVLVPVTLPRLPQGSWKRLITVGSNIYYIGSPFEQAPSSSVSILDCRSHTLHKAPSMHLKRRYAVATLLDGKIYVGGCCKDCDSSNWMEVFDPETQAWEAVSGPWKDFCGCNHLGKTAGIDGTLYIFGSVKGADGLAYTPKEGKWERVKLHMRLGWLQGSYCVIGNVLYYYWEGEFNWYDTKVSFWRILKGVKGLPKFSRYHARLADYGGKMAVLWEKDLASTEHKEKMIFCAVIR